MHALCTSINEHRELISNAAGVALPSAERLQKLPVAAVTCPSFPRALFFGDQRWTLLTYWLLA